MKFLQRMFLAVLTILLVSSLLVATTFLLIDQKADAKEKKYQVPQAQTAKATGSTRRVNPVTGVDTITVRTSQVTDLGTLRLINSEHQTKSAVMSQLSKAPGRSFQVRKDILKHLNQFLAEADKQIGGMYLSSAFRTERDQQKIYQETANKKLVQKPGYSEHQTGLAVDLQPVKALKGFYGEDLRKEKAFMAANSWRFGFILRYPENKVNITGIDHEYWHFRYVGLPHAQYMHEHDLALEEYHELLKYKGQLEIREGGQDYTVYWREARDGVIHYPGGVEAEVSSTNTGAYIITVKRK